MISYIKIFFIFLNRKLSKKQNLILLILLLTSSFYIYCDKFKMVPQTANPGYVEKVVFSNDGTIFATKNSTNKTIKIWSIRGRLLKIYTNENTMSLGEMAFSNDGKYLAVSDYTSVKIWNLENDKRIMITNNKDGKPGMYFNSFDFLPDNKSIIIGTKIYFSTGIPGELNTESMEDLLSKITGEYNKEKFKSAYLFQNNKYTLKLDLDNYEDLLKIYYSMGYRYTTNDYKNSIELWSIEGRYIKSIAMHNNDNTTEIKYLKISPDGNTILSWGTDNKIKLFDMMGNMLNIIEADNPYYITNLAFSSNSKLFGWIGSSGLKICNLNGVFLLNTNKTMIVPDLNIDKRIYTTSGTKGTSEDYYFLLRIKNFDDEILAETEELPNIMYSKISPDTRHIVAGCMDGTVNIINSQTGSIVTVINDNEGEWLVYTPDGYWDASINGGKLVAMISGLDAYSVDQFAAKFNRPDIILERLGFEEDLKDEIEHYYKQYKKRLNKLNINEEEITAELHVPEVKISGAKQNDKFVDISFFIFDSKYPLKRYNFYVNDVPIFGSYGKEVNGNNLSITEKIELTSGKNKVEISCINEKGAESFRAMNYFNYNKNVKGDLYFIGFGVSEYKDNRLNLKYADKDVIDIEALVKKFKGTYNKVISKIFLNKDVTVSNIKTAKEILKDSKVDDTLILFIAGHGVHDFDDESTYYFLTYNADINNLKGTAAPFELIEDILNGINPRNKLFLMDTCESGERDEDTESNYYSMADVSKINARGIRGLKKIAKPKSSNVSSVNRTYLLEKDRFIYNDLHRRSGAIIFSSSKGDEFSYEKEELENGLFTEEIINAFMSKEADKDNDGYISTDELRSFVIKAVSESSNNLQHPTIDRDNIYQKFYFPVLKQ